MRRLALSCLVIAALGPATFAQAHKQTGHAAPAQVHFPNNTVHFPNNTVNFPNNTTNFPNNGGMNFPNNGALNFTNYGGMSFPNNGAMNFPNNGSLNFPSNSFNFPSYNSGIYNNPIPYNTVGKGGQSAAAQTAQANQMAAMMGMPFGVGSVYQAVPHYHSSYHAPHSSRYRSVVHNASTNRTTPLTPTQRHYAKVVSDLDSLPPHFTLADTHRSMFNNDMMTLAEGANRPSSVVVKGLSDNLAGAMTRRRSLVLNTAALAEGLQIVLNAGRIPKANVDLAIAQTHILMRDAGFSHADLQTISADMHKVANHARTNVAQVAPAPAALK